MGNIRIADALHKYASLRCEGNARNARRSRELMGYSLRGSPLLDTCLKAAFRLFPRHLLELEARVSDKFNGIPAEVVVAAN